MATPGSKRSKPVRLPKKLVGRAVAFVGTFGYGTRQIEEMTALVRAEGGRVVDGVRKAPDYLVVGEGVRRKPPAALVGLREKFPSAHVIDQVGFYGLVAPTADDLMAVLADGPHPYEIWNEMREAVERAKLPFDLSGRDFRHLDLTGTNLAFATVDGGDFRGGKLAGTRFSEVRGARFDGADMRDCDFVNARDCSLKRVNLDDGRFNPSEFHNCDFSGAVLTLVLGSSTRATDCTFARVKAAGSDFDDSEFRGCDFTKADLSGARLEKSDFTGATLAGADLSRADARGVKFVNADLRRAKFRDAVLTGADFTGAKIDGADFCGANLTAVIAPGLDATTAKNFRPRAAREAGPNMTELAKVATASKKFATSIELDLGPDETVVLTPGWRTYGAQGNVEAGYSHEWKDGGLGASVDAPTFEQGMLNLVDLWDRGTPKFETVTVEAKKCPRKGKDLWALAVAAWYEAFGRAEPATDGPRD